MHQLERWEWIYEQVIGACVSEGVRSEAERDGALFPFMEEEFAARQRLCDRLGTDPAGDPDAAALVNAWDGFSRALARLMYRYGLADGAPPRKTC